MEEARKLPVRIAIASDKGDTLSGHFGSCLRFLVYQVSPGEIRLVDIRADTYPIKIPDGGPSPP